MRYYIIAGEASGDLHSSNLMKELRAKDAEAEFRCWGGDLMEKEGAKLVKHYRETAYMGFLEVVKHLPAIIKNINLCKKDILENKPDALILVDYPGFNLRIAEFARQNGIRTYYYISPQVWAWKSSRVKKIKSYVDRLFVILPFEKEFYKKYNYDVEFVGHPLLDEIENYKKKQKTGERNQATNKPVIALLPGSRKQEIVKMLPIMLRTIPFFPEYEFIIAGANSIPQNFYDKIIKEHSTDRNQLSVVFEKTYDLLSNSTAALVTSGTATLETALFGVPEVVCYKGSYLSYRLAKWFIKVKYISLVNLIMEKAVVTELIQNELTYFNLKTELHRLLNNNIRKEQITADYGRLKEILGGSGASRKTAEAIIRLLKT